MAGFHQASEMAKLPIDANDASRERLARLVKAVSHTTVDGPADVVVAIEVKADVVEGEPRGGVAGGFVRPCSC
jgi:hypothetical protein